MAGRKFANNCRCLRKPRMACSGRSERSSESYFQSPTAPNRIASACFASSSVDSGSGWPFASYPAPPTGASSISNVSPSAFRTFTASFMISGPMPSPGSTAIFIAFPYSVFIRLDPDLSDEAVAQPRLFGQALIFELTDLGGVAQCERDVVEAVQQAKLPESGNLERILRAVARQYDLALQIHSQLEAIERVGLVEQLVDLRLRQHDRQQTALKTVVEENIGETR